MSISRYIVVAVARCSCADSRLAEGVGLASPSPRPTFTILRLAPRTLHSLASDGSAGQQGRGCASVDPPNRPVKASRET